MKDARPGLPAYPAETVQCPKCGNAWKRDGLTVRYVDASAARRHAGSLGGATSVIGEHASYQEHRDRFTWPEDGWLYWECARCHYGWETRTLT